MTCGERDKGRGCINVILIPSKMGASEASKTNIMINLIFVVVHGCFLIFILNV